MLTTIASTSTAAAITPSSSSISCTHQQQQSSINQFTLDTEEESVQHYKMTVKSSLCTKSATNRKITEYFTQKNTTCSKDALGEQRISSNAKSQCIISEGNSMSSCSISEKKTFTLSISSRDRDTEYQVLPNQQNTFSDAYSDSLRGTPKKSFELLTQNCLKLTPIKKPQHYAYASSSNGTLTPSSLLSKRLQNALKLSSAKSASLKQLTIFESLAKSTAYRVKSEDSLVTQVTPENAFGSRSTSVLSEELDNPFEGEQDRKGSIVSKTKITYRLEESIVLCMKQLLENSVKSSVFSTPAESPLLTTAFNNFEFLLPPIGESPSLFPDGEASTKRKTLVLDLDETLVHCTTGTRPDNFDFEFNVLFKGENIKFYCKMRPFLFYFLGQVQKNFEIVVFTASQQPYADALLDILDPKNEFFHHRLFRSSCTLDQGFYIKNLTRLGRPIEHTIIVDNSPQAFVYQIENGIPIVSWFGNLEDKELLRLSGFLDDLYRHEGDIREFLRSHFDWLKK